MHKPKAIALYSGGLDSTLAILVMLRHGVEIEALKFLMPFGGDVGSSSSHNLKPYPAAEQFGFNVELYDLGWEFVEIVKNPKYGYGKNMNPCIDCRLLMLKKAKDYMETSGADFVITGEVIGQRPMTQLRNSMNLIEKQCGLEGRLVRPLSGKLLKPTIPEKEGLIKRDWLLDFSNRSRKRQTELAEQFGLKDYNAPAGGCFLTDKHYCLRLKDLFAFNKNFDLNDIDLLRVGRQFRLTDRCKFVVGRNESENDAISSLARDTDIIFEVKNTGSPIGLLRGEPDSGAIKLAASITVRYSDSKHENTVIVDILTGLQKNMVQVKPADNNKVVEIRI